MQNDTNALAAKIMRAKARGTAGTFSDAGASARQHTIDGMCDAWEFMTGETADEETLAAAAKVHNDEVAAQEARDNAEGICATDIVTIGKGKTEWVVVYVDLYSTTVKSTTGHGAPTKRVDNDTLTLVAKGRRHVDFYRV